MLRRYASPLWALFAGSLAAEAAHAGFLTAATWSQVTQGYTFTRSASELGLGTNGNDNFSFLQGGRTTLTLALAFPQTTVGFFVPKSANGQIDLHVSITQGGPQEITATRSMATAGPAIPGTVVVRTALHAAMGVDASMFQIGGNTLLQVPLHIGAPGQVTGTFSAFGTHQFTVDFYGWTAGRLTFTGLTSRGAALPDVVAPGSWGLSPIVGPITGGGGRVTLVSPTRISVDGPVSQRRTVSFSSLTLHFFTDLKVPEPGTWLLLAAGLAALLPWSRRAS